MIRFLQQVAYGLVLLALVTGCSSTFSKEPIAKLFDAQNRPFCPHYDRISSPASLGRPPSVCFGQVKPVLAMEPKIIDFSLSWSFAIGSKKKKTKYGVHDHPLFIDYCLKAAEQKIAENPAIVSTFEEPLEDAYRDKRLEVLKKDFPRLYSYALEHEEASSMDLWLLGELERKFGQIQGASVILIGAQQGRLAALLVDLYQVEKITVIDLPACLELAKWKLRDRNLPSFQWVSPQQIENSIQEADFLMSNTIVSRLSRHWQDLLIQAVFPKVKGGCVLYKPTPRHWGVKTWDRYQFLERLKKRCLVEEPFVECLTANSDSLMLFSSKRTVY